MIGCCYMSVYLFLIKTFNMVFLACCMKLEHFKSGSMDILSMLHCWARSSGCQDLLHICAVTQSFLSAVCLCLRGASHELSNEVLTITFLSRCCSWFYRKQETCMFKHHIWHWLHWDLWLRFTVIKWDWPWICSLMDTYVSVKAGPKRFWLGC